MREFLWYKYGMWWNRCRQVIPVAYKNMFIRSPLTEIRYWGNLLPWHGNDWLALPSETIRLHKYKRVFPAFLGFRAGGEVHQPPRYTPEPYPIWTHYLAGEEDQVSLVILASMAYRKTVSTITRQIMSTVARIRILQMYQTAIITPSTWE